MNLAQAMQIMDTPDRTLHPLSDRWEALQTVFAHARNTVANAERMGAPAEEVILALLAHLETLQIYKNTGKGWRFVDGAGTAYPADTLSQVIEIRTDLIADKGRGNVF